MKDLLSPSPAPLPPNDTSRRHFAWKCLLLILIMGVSACQTEKKTSESQAADTAVLADTDSTSEQLIEALKQSYQQKIDSIISIHNQGNSEFQIEVAALTKRTKELEAYNQNLDNQIGQQADAILKLQDSLQAALDTQEFEENTFFTPVALTEELLDSLVLSVGSGFESTTFDLFDSTSMKQDFAQEVDSLIQEINYSNSLVAEQDQRLNGVLTDLAVAIEPKSTRTNNDYEEVIVNALLSTVSDDTLIVNQYNRGFYSKQDLNALVEDYKIRKTQHTYPGTLIIYRRKKKQDQQEAVIQIDGTPYRFARNTIDTVLVNNVFAVNICDQEDHCQRMAFSGTLSNYMEISLRKNVKSPDLTAVNPVLGDFYARQVISTKRKK